MNHTLKIWRVRNRRTPSQSAHPQNLGKHAFTLIELIVVMAVIAILVLLAMPRFSNRTQQANLTKDTHQAKVLENATEMFIAHGGQLEDYLELIDKDVLDLSAEEQGLIDIEGHVGTVPSGSYHEQTHQFIIQHLNVKVPTGGKSDSPYAVYVSENGKVFIDRTRPLKGHSSSGQVTPPADDSFEWGTRMSTGSSHVIALREDGTVWTWGDNQHGQLGIDSYAHNYSPVQVQGLTDVISVEAGSWHSLALKRDGTVWGMGDNYDGQLGVGGGEYGSLTPVQIQGLSGVKTLSAGGFHSLALKEDGTVWAWGDNQNGQLGDGTTTDSAQPIQVPGLTDVKSIAAGGRASFALKEDGTLWAWGANGNGQLGLGSTTQQGFPIQVPGFTDVKAVAAGHFHSLILKGDGTVWAAGYNWFGALGDDTRTNRSTHVQVHNITDVKSLSASWNLSLAMKEDGTVWGWGLNDYGEIGDGTDSNIRIAPVQTQTLSDAKDVKAGVTFAALLTVDGDVQTFGYNNRGQLGDGTTTNRNIPIQVFNIR